jgi:hypothetical protein
MGGEGEGIFEYKAQCNTMSEGLPNVRVKLHFKERLNVPPKVLDYTIVYNKNHTSEFDCEKSISLFVKNYSYN